LNNTFVLAKKLRNIVEEEQFNSIGNITISLGVAEFNEDDTINSIFKKADEALYEAKHSGKNKIIKRM
jgi:diguanylate cyclase (GGDEF)-like protein